MQKQHWFAVCADLRNPVAKHPRTLPDQGIARSDDIGDFIANVMNSSVGVAVQKLGDRGSFAQRLDEFNLGVRQGDKDGNNTMLWQRHRCRNLRAECRAINLGSLLGVLYRDCNVIEPTQHDTPPPFSLAPSRSQSRYAQVSKPSWFKPSKREPCRAASCPTVR